jgi:Bacterial Ig domain
MQNNYTRLLLTAIFGFLSFALHLKAEGSKQLSPTATDLVNTNLGNTFGRYDGTDVQRLYVHIKDAANEQVFLGFSQPRSSLGYPCTTGNATAYYRIKNAAGTVVYPLAGNVNGQLITPNITGWASAVAGPSQIVGAAGYAATVFNPAGLGNGDYYVEFSITKGAFAATAFGLEWWDITVATKAATPTAINGRVFAKNWTLQTPAINCTAGGFTCGTADAFGTFDRAFSGSFHVYSPIDSVVTKVDFKNSGLRPVAFNMFFNATGPGATGNVTNDRKSVSGSVGTPLYPLFLNDPDVVDYPSGSVGAYVGEPFYVSCDALTGQFFVTITKAGQIDVLIDLDKTSGAFKYDPGTRDVALSLKVVPALGELPPYRRAINWNGKDGLGAQVNLALPLDFAINYAVGVFHLPIYDAEFLTTGFTFNSVRPVPPATAAAVSVYYDDSNIVAANLNTNPKVQLNGCVAPCHKWNNACYGDLMTINTWFFGSEEKKSKTGALPICLVDAVNDVFTVSTPSLAISVLANDKGIALDSSSISVAGQTAPLHGTIAVDILLRKITYTPTVGFFGKDSFRYRICDSNNFTCDTAWVILTMPSLGGFTFNCGTATTTGTFTANGTAGQAGTLVVPMTGATAGSVTLTVVGTGFSGTLTTTLTAGQLSVTIPITYDGTGVSGSRTLTITSARGTGTCSKAVTVVCPTIAAATATLVQPTCAVATGTITVTAPSTGVTYSFDNGTTYQTSNISPALVAGTYSIITKTTSSTCLSTAVSKIITAQPTPAPLPTITIVQPSCGVTTGTITVTTPTTGVTYSFNNGTTYQASATSSALTTGTYQVIVKNSTSNCTSTAASATINAALSKPAVPTVSVAQPTCAVATGTITVTAPTTGVTYSFNNGATYQASATSTALASGTYQVLVKDNASSCTTAAATTTIINPQPVTPSVPTLSVAQPTCTVGTGTITVTAPTGFTYSIDGVDYSNTSGIFNNVSPNTYTVTVKSIGGCMAASGASATILPIVTTPVLSLTQPTCAVATGGSIITAPVGAGFSYSIDGVDFSNTTGSFTNLPVGTYTITVKNGSGCLSAGTTFTVVPPVPAPTLTVVQPTCTVATGSITVTAPTTNIEYSFDNGATYQTAVTMSGLSAGVYAVVAKNTALGCASDPTSATINVAPTHPVQPTTTVTQPTCAVATGVILVTNPTSGVTYSFDNGATYQASATSSATSAGVYQVLVKDNVNTCLSTVNATTIDAQPTTPSVPVTSVSQPNCTTATGIITVTSPSSGVVYSFDNGATYQVAALLSGLASGVHEVMVKGSASGCATVATATTVDAALSIPSVPVASVTQPTCTVATGVITVTSPSTGVTYSFDNGATYQASNISTALIAATYQVIVKDDVSNCPSAAVATIVNVQPIIPAIPTTTISQPTCAVATGKITVTNPSSGVTYSFDNGATFQTGATSSPLITGAYEVMVKTIVGGCESAAATATIDGQTLPPAVPTTTVNDPTCSVSTGTITVTAPTTGVTYSFDNGLTYQPSATSNALAAGTYQVLVKDDLTLCASAANGTVISPQPAIPTTPVATVTQPTCTVLTGTITVTSPASGVSYSFDDGITFQPSATSSALTTGIYQVVVKDDVSTCASNAVATGINAPPATPSVPTTSVSQPTCFVATGTITVTNPSVGVTYSFDNGTTFQATATSNALPSATYQVLMKNNVSGCESTATATTINPQPVTPTTPTFTYVAENCTGTTGSITVTTPLASGFTYSINGSDYSNTTGLFTGLSVGLHTVSVKSSGGCLSPSVPVTFLPWMRFNLKVMLEGTYQTATGLMQTTLNQRGLLPGQTPIGQFAAKTPKGQPFKTAPWLYAGTEGDTITTYPATVVDWVLISLRTDSTSSTNVFRTAGWLHSDGHISFITPCFNVANGSYFVLVEHRNHVGVLSPLKVTAVNSMITQDFTTGDSYIRINPPSTGQKLKGSKWVMMAGDGKKDTPTTNYDVNFNDAQLWKLQSGIFDQYLYGDYNMDADINFSDSFLWKLNSGKYSGVPHW